MLSYRPALRLPMDARLLELCCCPVTHQPLVRLSPRALALVQHHLRAHPIETVGGEPITDVDAALATRDGQRIYPVVDGIAVLLPEACIAASRIDGFALD